MNAEALHYKYITELAEHPYKVGLDESQIMGYILEPTRYKAKKANPNVFTNMRGELCDIFWLFDWENVACEVKGSVRKDTKAIDQIVAGAEFSQVALNKPCYIGIAAYYKPKKFDLLTIDEAYNVKDIKKHDWVR